MTAVAALTIALVLAVGGAGAATLLSAQPETLTVGAVVSHITAEAPQASSPAAADFAPAAESTVTAAPEQAAESTAQQAEPAPAQTEKPETAEIAPAAPEEAVETPEAPAQPAEDTALEEENSPAILLEETPELAAQDPQAPAADGTTQNDTASQHTPEDSVLLTPEQIQQALDSGALEDAEAQCIDLTDENGFSVGCSTGCSAARIRKRNRPTPAGAPRTARPTTTRRTPTKRSPVCAPLTASCIISMPTALNRTM